MLTCNGSVKKLVLPPGLGLGIGIDTRREAHAPDPTGVEAAVGAEEVEATSWLEGSAMKPGGGATGPGPKRETPPLDLMTGVEVPTMPPKIGR